MKRNTLADIVLNRRGLTHVDPKPGFYSGRNGKPMSSHVISQRFGRIGIGHPELVGRQHWGSAANEGRRTVEGLVDIYS